jgi:hypothetical protein
MTVRAVAGLLTLHALYLVVGAAVLWAIRGWTRWRTLGRLLGLAYLLGIASLGIVWTVVLVVGVPFGSVTIAVTSVALVALGAGVGARRGHRVERGDGARLARPALVALGGVALVAVYLLALFRVARLQGLFSFDAWAFWVARGKAVYFFDTLDAQIFSEVPHPSYPPVIPILDAAAFHAMGADDVVTLHVQYWLLAVGFVAAVAGLLSRRVPAWILWPSLALAFVLPRMRSNVLAAQADLPLDYLVVAAAVLLALWIADRRPWRLPAATLLLGCGVLVKREGLVLAACVVAAALVATAPTRRTAWPRLAVVGGVVALAAVPWRLWYRAQGIEGETGTAWLGGVWSERTVDSLRLAVDVLAGTGRWSVVPTVAVAAVVLAAVWGRRSHAVFAAALVVLLTLAGAATSVVFTDIGVTDDEAVSPIVRLTAGTVLAMSCLTPLLLAGVWVGRPRGEPIGAVQAEPPVP